MSRTIVSWTSVLLLIFLSNQSFGQNNNETGRPFITNYAPTLHDANPQNWCITQDDRGVMYFGNSDGILEYDGYNWRLIKTPRNNVVRSLAKDKNGRIWVGGSGEIGYLAPDSIGKMVFVSLTPNVPEEKRNFNDVWGTSSYDDGIYFSAFRENFRWFEDSLHVIEQDSNTFIFIGTIDNSLYKYQFRDGIRKREGDDYKLLSGTKELFQNTGLSAWAKYDEGEILILTRAGNFYVHDGETLIPLHLQDGDIINNYRPRRVLVLPNNNLAIGTLRGGVFILDRNGKILQHYHRANGLQDNVVYEMFLDNSNALWLALDNGVARFPISSSLTYFNAEMGLTSNVLALERHNGLLYVGTTEGASYLDNESGIFRDVKDIGFQCFDLLKVENELLTASSKGVQRVEGNKVVDIIDDFNFSALALYHYKKNPEYIFVGLGRGVGVIKILGNNKYEVVGRIEGFTDGIWSFVEDDEGRVWLGAETDGAIRLTFNSWPDIEKVTIERFGVDHGLPRGQVFISKLNGKIYFTPVKGFYTFDEETQKFSMSDTFGQKAMESGIGLISNSSDDVFVAYYKGAAQAIKNKEGKYDLITAPFRPFENATMTNLYTEDGGITWFSSSIGLIRYDANLEVDYNTDFNTLIRQVIINEDSTIFYGTSDGHADYNLPYGSNNITFSYVASFYVQENLTEYKVWLEGYDNDWSAWSTRIEKEYTNLKEGQYTFHVVARNIYDVESQNATFDFAISPPFHRTVFAYIIYIIIGGFIIWLIVRWRTDKLKQQQQELENTVNDRTKELSQRAEELAVINSVQQGLVAEMDLDSIYQLVGKKIQEIFDSQIVSIASFNFNQNTEVFQFLYEDGALHYPEPRPIDIIRQYLIDSKKQFIVNEPNDQALTDLGVTSSEHKPVPGTKYPKSMVFMPMIVGDQVKGHQPSKY